MVGSEDYEDQFNDMVQATTEAIQRRDTLSYNINRDFVVKILFC